MKAALSSLRQFLSTERPVKIMNNPFHFILKIHVVIEIFQLVFRIFDYVGKRLVKKVKVICITYDVTN